MTDRFGPSTEVELTLEDAYDLKSAAMSEKWRMEAEDNDAYAEDYGHVADLMRGVIEDLKDGEA